MVYPATGIGDGRRRFRGYELRDWSCAVHLIFSNFTMWFPIILYVCDIIIENEKFDFL